MCPIVGGNYGKGESGCNFVGVGGEGLMRCV